MLLPVFARDLLQVGPAGARLALLGDRRGRAGWAGSRWRRIAERIPAGPAAGRLGDRVRLFVGAFALSTSFLLSLALLAAAGFCMILSTATANSILQSLVPNGLRGG
jgi:hypothetical protein